MFFLTLQKRQERFCKGQIAEVVGREFSLDDVKVNALRLVEEHPSLDARVQEHTVQIGMSFGNTDSYQSAHSSGQEDKAASTLGSEIWDLFHFCDVKRHSAGILLAVSVNEFFKLVLSPPNSDHIGALLDHSIRQSFPNSTRRPYDEDFFILKRHYDDL